MANQKKSGMVESIKVSMPERIDVALSNGTTVSIPKLKTGDFLTVLMSIQDLPTKLFEMLGSTVDDVKTFVSDSPINGLLSILPKILVTAYEESISIISAATCIEKDYLLNDTDLCDLLKICEAVINVNKVEELSDLLKNLGKRLGLSGRLKRWVSQLAETDSGSKESSNSAAQS